MPDSYHVNVPILDQSIDWHWPDGTHGARWVICRCDTIYNATTRDQETWIGTRRVEMLPHLEWEYAKSEGGSLYSQKAMLRIPANQELLQQGGIILNGQYNLIHPKACIHGDAGACQEVIMLQAALKKEQIRRD